MSSGKIAYSLCFLPTYVFTEIMKLNSEGYEVDVFSSAFQCAFSILAYYKPLMNKGILGEPYQSILVIRAGITRETHPKETSKQGSN